MNESQRMNAALVVLAAIIIGKKGICRKENIAEAIAIADDLDEKLKGEENGEDDDTDGDNADEDSEGEDSDDDDQEETEESDDSDSDDEEDAGNDDADEDGEEDDDSEDNKEDKPKKKANKKSPSSTAGSKAGKAKKPDEKKPVKGKKNFKKKPQSYERENDTHKEIFSGILKAVSPTWKKDPVTKKRAKDASVKLEGADFLDAEGNVLASFKQSVKKAMVKK